MHAHISDEMRRGIDNCQACHNMCLESVIHCLGMGGAHADSGHIRLLLDCAEICQTSANYMLRGSNLHMSTCGVCADVCQRCADDCARFGDDKQMSECADMCRRCAESCRQMAKAMPSNG